jgi:hypothetical protein
MPQQRREGRKNVKHTLLQKQTSRRDLLRGSVTLAGSAFLVPFLPATLLRTSSGGHMQQTPSPADLPFADLDPVWGNGIINSERWVQIVYLTL